MGNKHSKKEKKIYKRNAASIEVGVIPDASEEVDVPPVDSYGKLINWLLKMSEDEHIDLDDPDFVTKIQQSVENKPKKQYTLDLNRHRSTDNFDSYGASELPSYSRDIPPYNRSPKSCEDIEEENELESIHPTINLEVEEEEVKPQNTLSVRQRGILMKQRSVSSESSECRTSGSKSFDSDAEISDVLRMKEKILLQNRYQKFARAQKQLQKQNTEINEPSNSNFLQVGGPVLRKQKSESCARSARLSPRDFRNSRDSKRYRKSSKSCNDIIDARLVLPNPMMSRQTTLSDENHPTFSRQTTYSDERNSALSRQTTFSDDRMLSRQTTFSDDDYMNTDGDKPEMIKLCDMSSNINSVSFDDYRLCPSNRRMRRGRFSNTLSKSVGNLIDKSSRLRDSIRKKSSSLFTIKQAEDDTNIATDPVEEQEKVLDDRLLDGNMSDILYAMDALWPDSSFT